MSGARVTLGAMTDDENLDGDLAILRAGLVALARSARQLAERVGEASDVDDLYDAARVLNDAIDLVEQV
ncbi:hypothetical protein CJ179_50235, partial [Rhodococcus sp. ACS1]